MLTEGPGVTQVEALGGGKHPLCHPPSNQLEQELQVWWAKKSLAHVGPEATPHPVCPCPRPVCMCGDPAWDKWLK